MVHTAFAGESDYEAKYEAMKKELSDFIDRDVNEDEAIDFDEYFTEKYN